MAIKTMRQAISKRILIRIVEMRMRRRLRWTLEWSSLLFGRLFILVTGFIHVGCTLGSWSTLNCACGQWMIFLNQKLKKSKNNNQKLDFFHLRVPIKMSLIVSSSNCNYVLENVSCASFLVPCGSFKINSAPRPISIFPSFLCYWEFLDRCVPISKN